MLPAAREGGALPLDEGADFLGPGVHRQRARADAPYVHRSTISPSNAVGPLLDDVQERTQLSLVQQPVLPQISRHREDMIYPTKGHV